MENRRRAERQPALWIGSCHLEGEESDLWRDCAIFDVSKLGVGIDLRHPDASELLSRRITLLLGVGPSIDMTVTGAVRNSKSGPDDIVQAGIEFVGLTEIEHSIVDLVERRAVSRSGA